MVMCCYFCRYKKFCGYKDNKNNARVIEKHLKTYNVMGNKE